MAPTTHVVNCHHPMRYWPTQRWHYVGRSMPHRSPEYAGSALANPFKVGRDGERSTILQRYRRWLWAQLSAEGPALEELRALLKLSLQPGGVALACWCAPRPCHADVIAAAIGWLWKQGAKPTEGS